MAKRIAEAELILPALKIMAASKAGIAMTSDLIQGLAHAFRPKGEDNEILEGRHDTKFSQKVRNLKSHRTLEKMGVAERVNGGFRITDAGRRALTAALG